MNPRPFLRPCAILAIVFAGFFFAVGWFGCSLVELAFGLLLMACHRHARANPQ